MYPDDGALVRGWLCLSTGWIVGNYKVCHQLDELKSRSELCYV